jgi:cytidylate kinase
MATPLSPNYRHDDDQGLDPDLRTYLDQAYLQQLPHLATVNPKLLVVFSGGNAMGKSTISQKISQQFGGLVIENDAIKRCLLQRYPGLERVPLSQLTWQYTMDLYRRLPQVTPNGLVVRDGVIDWYFDRILPVFEQAGYALFIIGFDISRPKATELILRRGNTSTTQADRLQVLLDDHAIHNKRFRSLYTPDVMLDDQTIFNQDLVLDALRAKLKSLGNA